MLFVSPSSGSGGIAEGHGERFLDNKRKKIIISEGENNGTKYLIS